VLSHVIQFGRNGTEVDYLSDGGQGNLFPFSRLSADLTLGKRHTITALYQPLDLRTSQLLPRDLVIDDALFPAGTPTDFRYGFPFWRLTYLYDLLPSPDDELGVGAGVQIRNATITFASQDGTVFRSNENIGPVPLLKVRFRKAIGKGWWLGAEADGLYASGRIITGSNNDFLGSILDASLRSGVEIMPSVDVFVNLRGLMGGARGQEEDATGPGDGYTRNWLYTFSASLGVSLRVPGP